MASFSIPLKTVWSKLCESFSHRGATYIPVLVFSQASRAGVWLYTFIYSCEQIGPPWFY